MVHLQCVATIRGVICDVVSGPPSPRIIMRSMSRFSAFRLISVFFLFFLNGVLHEY